MNTGIEEVNDAGEVQLAKSCDLALETIDASGMGRVEDFHRDSDVENGVFGAIDNAESPCTDPRAQHVTTEELDAGPRSAGDEQVGLASGHGCFQRRKFSHSGVPRAGFQTQRSRDLWIRAITVSLVRFMGESEGVHCRRAIPVSNEGGTACRGGSPGW